MARISRKTIASTGAALTLAATAILTGAGPAAADGMYDTCLPGRACITFAQGVYAGKVWVFEGCGYHPVNDKFKWAEAHGNPFKIFYNNGSWDQVDRWQARSLDGINVANHVEIYC
ncbi:hypothetical protein [Streptomyces varsoviensis]|uniref:hypothetical protein n=1 Tax=Streptomyces varsoviensis TaxID=67373 RepID=UPI0006621700|nr:hypothetical protein [Streptomyces varsoviensis]